MEKKETKLKYILLGAGCVLTLLSLLPFFLMGENSIITYSDQLDGELLTYILNAKHLFDGLDVYPELMNGIPAGGMVSPAPGFVPFFRFIPPFAGFMLMTVVSKLSAFVSMYLLSEKVTKKSIISFIVGMVFMMIPFYPVYGLSIMGQAFLWYAFINLAEEKCKVGNLVLSYLLIVLYALFSSVALVGFAIIITIFVLSAVLLFKDKKIALRVLIGNLLLGAVYAVENKTLVASTLKLGYSFTSHKSEVFVRGIDFLTGFTNYFFGKEFYTSCFQTIIILFVLISVMTAVIVFRKDKKFSDYKPLILNAGFILSTLVIICIYLSSVVASLRNGSSGLFREFNFDRFSWMLPVAWFLLFAQSASLLADAFEKVSKGRKGVIKQAYLYVLVPFALVIFFMAGMKSDLKTTTMKMIKKDAYKQVTFSQFYSKDLFDEVDELIGRDKNEYSVISLGLYPASAAYNGFKCLDAYSNNYDVNYKHEFRKIMEKELAKSDYYTEYFDNWGNRCYIYLSAYRTGINADFYNIVFENIELDYKKAKEMGADYVISASPILDYNINELKLLNSNPIRSDKCWYELYVYEILDSE